VGLFKSKRRRRAERLEMARAVEKIRDEALNKGLDPDLARGLANKKGRMMRRRMNQTGAERALKHNVAEYGTAAGGVLAAAGGVISAFPGIGTVVGAIVAAGGAGLAAAGKKQRADAERLARQRAELSMQLDALSKADYVNEEQAATVAAQAREMSGNIMAEADRIKQIISQAPASKQPAMKAQFEKMYREAQEQKKRAEEIESRVRQQGKARALTPPGATAAAQGPPKGDKAQMDEDRRKLQAILMQRAYRRPRPIPTTRVGTVLSFSQRRWHEGCIGDTVCHRE